MSPLPLEVHLNGIECVAIRLNDSENYELGTKIDNFQHKQYRKYHLSRKLLIPRIGLLITYDYFYTSPFFHAVHRGIKGAFKGH